MGRHDGAQSRNHGAIVWFGLDQKHSRANDRSDRRESALIGSYTPGADAMMFAVEQVEPVSKGRIGKCMGTELPAPTAEFALLLHTDKLKKRTDNSFHASGMIQSGSSFSLPPLPASW